MTAKLPRTSKKGFRLEGDKAEALLLHGYTGSPYDLRPVSDFLSKQGVAVTVPLLKGHGTRAQDLFAITAENWLMQAQESLTKLDAKKPLIIGGLSMGALMAILLSAECATSRALLLFSPSLKLTRLAQLTIASAQYGLLDRNISLRKLSGGSDIADPIAKARTPSYTKMPIAGLLEFEILRLKALQRIEKVDCPIFVGFGKNDHAINANDSHREIMLRSKKTIVAKFYERSKHVITLDYDRERLGIDVIRFLTMTCGIAL